MLVAHKIELNPNNKQRTYFAKACGIARDAYNWGLAEWERQYKAGEKPNAFKLCREYNAMKRTEKPWALEVTKSAPQRAIENLGEAYKRAFDRIKMKETTASKKNPFGFPVKKNKFCHDSFAASTGPLSVGKDSFKVTGRKIKLPKIGWVRINEPLRFKGQIKSAVVSRAADRWFVSIMVDADMEQIRIKDKHHHGTVGVDLGSRKMITLSKPIPCIGEVIANPKPYQRAQKHLRRLSKDFSRTKKGSKNRRKAAARLAKQHWKIANIRKDAQHKATHSIVKYFDSVVVENLSVKGMVKNHKLAKAVSDVGFSEIRRQVEYKSKWNDVGLVVADRFFPSSKKCSTPRCGYINQFLKLEEEWQCPMCGVTHDRDINAARNLASLGPTDSSSECDACGDPSSGLLVTAGETSVCEAGIRHKIRTDFSRFL